MHGPQRAPLGRWVEGVNGGQLSQGAIVASGADIGLEEVPIPGQSGTATVPGARSSVVAPSGARAQKMQMLRPSTLLVVAPGAAVETGGDGVVAPAGTFETDATDFFPGGTRAIKMMDPVAPTREDVMAWLAPDAPDVDLSMDTASVALVTGEQSPRDLFDDEASAFDPVEEGAAIEQENTVFAMVGDSVIDEERVPSLERVFDAGTAAPLSGATFTMAVLSTPDASVAGQSANPLVGMDTETVLQQDQVQRLLGNAGVTDADEIEWLAGPRRVPVDDEGDVSVLGTSAESGVQTFAAVLAGSDGPWRVVAHVVRVTTGDHVLVVGLQRRPVSTPELDDPSALADAENVQYGRELLRQAAQRLQSE